MRDYKLEQKYRKMIRRDKFLRVLVYVSMALVLGSVFLWKRFLNGSYWIFWGMVLFSWLVCVVHWQNLRCPRCGKLLTEYRASIRRVPAFCISCGLELKSLKTNEYDLQPPVREEVGQTAPTDELTVKCREIARRDRVLRPMKWLSIVAIALLMLLRDNEILSEPVSNVLVCVGCVFMVVVWLLWEHNLRCPVCVRHLITDYRQNRMRFFSLPESHVCESCGAHLKFTK